MSAIAIIALINAAMDLILRLVLSLSGPKSEDLKEALINAKKELDAVSKDVADYKVTY